MDVLWKCYGYERNRFGVIRIFFFSFSFCQSRQESVWFWRLFCCPREQGNFEPVSVSLTILTTEGSVTFCIKTRENEVSWSKEIYDIYWQLFTAIWGIWSFYLGKGIANVFGWFSFVKKCLMILGVFAIILNLGWIRCKPFFTKNWKSWLIFYASLISVLFLFFCLSVCLFFVIYLSNV